MKIYLLLISLFLISCEEDDCCVNIDAQCYSFDIRQCQTDGFADTVLETSSFTSREANMKRWLTENEFEVVELKLVLNYHEAVCEACDTCPQGDRYYVKIVDDGSVEQKAEDLRLLSFAIDDCTIFG